MSELLADTEYSALRPELRDVIREMELSFRAALLKMALQAAPELQAHLVEVSESVPRTFMLGHSWLYQKVSQFMDLGDLMEKVEREAATLARRTIQ
jgi:hypothetical protein